MHDWNGKNFSYKGKPVTLIMISGYRTPEYQSELYAQGRSLPGSIVTKADAYHSAHNWRIACDFGFQVGRAVMFDGPKEWWETLYKSAKAHGCEDITKELSWDKGHIQYGPMWDYIKKDLKNQIAAVKIRGMDRVLDLIAAKCK